MDLEAKRKKKDSVTARLLPQILLSKFSFVNEGVDFSNNLT